MVYLHLRANTGSSHTVWLPMVPLTEHDHITIIYKALWNKYKFNKHS